MILENVNKAYFLGIGGIGMSALARYFMHLNVPVYGYDKTQSPLTSKLIIEGASIIFEDEIDQLPSGILEKNTLFVFTPAIPADSKIKAFIESKSFTWLKRSQVLGILSKSHSCVAIAGTHGKTTISSMTAHILFNSEVGCQAFLGGIVQNYESNILLDSKSSLMVVEADEYDRSFLQLHPDTALISAMDADHLDIYGNHENILATFKEFATRTQENGLLIVHHPLKNHFDGYQKLLTYALDNRDADFYASDIEIIDGIYHFSLHYPKGIISNIAVQMPGLINLENAIGAAALSLTNGAREEEIKSAIGSFKGIKRRMEKILQTKNFIFYDDYAHHPEEIKAAISSVRKMHPEKEITVVFQPHLYSRTQDFANEFAESLSMADEVYLLDIYPARELPIPGVDSKIILSKMTILKKQICSKENLIAKLDQKQPDLLLSLGAGDIDRLIEPLKNHFS